jgi:hypothetical protein
MLSRTLFAVCAITLLSSACKKSEDDGKDPKTDTTDPANDPMSKFDGLWTGVAVREDTIEITTEVRLTYDPTATPPAATGILDMDAQWDITITADDQGTYVANGAGLLGDDVITISAIDFVDNNTITGNWEMDFGNEVKTGTVELSKD